MAETLRHVEWRDAHEDTAYPFGARTTRLHAETGRLLPDAAFLDASFALPDVVGVLRLSRVEISADGVTLLVGDDIDEARGTATASWTTLPEILSFRDPLDRPIGVLVVLPSLLASLASWGLGSYSFGREATEWSTRCVVVVPSQGLLSLSIDGVPLAGDVWLVGEDGVTWTVENYTAAGSCVGGLPAASGSLLRAHAVGEPLFKRAGCEREAQTYVYESPSPLKVLRVVQGATTFDVTPDAYGNIAISVASSLALDSVLRLHASGGELLLTTSVQQQAIQGNDPPAPTAASPVPEIPRRQLPLVQIPFQGSAQFGGG